MSYQKVKNEVKDIFIYLIDFYRNPKKTINKVPHWSWLSLIVLISIFAVVTGLLRGIFTANFLIGLVGIIFLPISSYFAVFIISGILYFLVVVFQDRNLNFKRLTTLVFITFIPTLTTYAFSHFHPAFIIIGVTGSFCLMYLGLLNRFQLNKNFIRISLVIFYGLILTSWAIGYFNINSENQKNQQFIEMNLKSQEILKKEMGN